MSATDGRSYALRLGDDALVLAQRLSEWSARAPELEEDLALTNIALDLLGQARQLLTRAGELEGAGRDEDDLAYLRGDREFLNALLVEQPNGDFARTIVRQLMFSTYQLALYDRLRDSADPIIAGIAEKAVKEVAYHRDHAREWTLRLGDGTEESHRRMQEGVDWMWPLAAELFEHDDARRAPRRRGDRRRRARAAPGVGALRRRRCSRRRRSTSPTTTYAATGGRRGEHSEALGHLLADHAVDAPRVPGGHVVSDRASACASWCAEVPDPEIPVLTIEDLGILRDVVRRRRAPDDHAHADVLRLPRDRPDPRRGRGLRGATRGSTTSRSCCSSSRRGPPSG